MLYRVLLESKKYIHGGQTRKGNMGSLDTRRSGSVNIGIVRRPVSVGAADDKRSQNVGIVMVRTMTL